MDFIPIFFSFQVGGHTRLMVLNPSTICKPLNFRELEFYQNIQDQDIKMFVPKYKGKLSRIRKLQTYNALGLEIWTQLFC